MAELTTGIDRMEEDEHHKKKNQDNREIRLDKNNMTEFGFARFCYPEEKQEIINQGYRFIHMGRRRDGSEEFLKIRVPQKYLLMLSAEKEHKLPALDNYYIDEIEESKERSVLKTLSRRAGWNQAEEDFDMLVRMAVGSYFLAGVHLDGTKIPLGSGALIKIGEDISWISMILVYEEVRRQGIAASLMFHCLNHARSTAENRVIGLDATAAGRKLYEQLGFEKSFSICRCLVPADVSFQPLPGTAIEPFNKFESIRNYLHNRGFGKRDRLFRSLVELSGQGCFLARNEGSITGVIMSRPGALYPYAGPLIAENEQVAANLLDKTREHWKYRKADQLFIDVPFEKFSMQRTEDGDPLANGRPFRVKKGFLQGGTMLRTFDRMYHVVSEKNKDTVSEYLKKNFTEKDDIAEMIDISVKSSGKTLNYTDKEKKMLRFQYAVGGPEYS